MVLFVLSIVLDYIVLGLESIRRRHRATILLKSTRKRSIMETITFFFFFLLLNDIDLFIQQCLFN